MDKIQLDYAAVWIGRKSLEIIQYVDCMKNWSVLRLKKCLKEKIWRCFRFDCFIFLKIIITPCHFLLFFHWPRRNLNKLHLLHCWMRVMQLGQSIKWVIIQFVIYD